MKALTRLLLGLFDRAPRSERVEPKLGRTCAATCTNEVHVIPLADAVADQDDIAAFHADIAAFCAAWDDAAQGGSVVALEPGRDAQDLCIAMLEQLDRLTPDVLALPIPTPVRDVLDALLDLRPAPGGDDG